MRKLLTIIIVSLSITLTSASAATDETAKTNFLFIIIDSWRYDHFTPDITPNLHSWSELGAVFDKYFVNATFTDASMMALFSSHLPEFKDSHLPTTFPILQDTLSEGGYSLATISPRDHAFRIGKEISLEHGFIGLPPGEDGAAQVVTQGIDQLTKLRRPFFLYLHFLDMHGPYDRENLTADELRLYKEFKTTRDPRNWGGVPKALERRKELTPLMLKKYADGGRYVDEQLNRLLEQIDFSTTIVFITSDHGEMFDVENVKKILHGGPPNESLNHVPLIVLGKGIAPARYGGYTQSLDVAPTILSLSGLAVPVGDEAKNIFSSQSENSSIIATHPSGKFIINKWGFKPIR